MLLNASIALAVKAETCQWVNASENPKRSSTMNVSKVVQLSTSCVFGTADELSVEIWKTALVRRTVLMAVHVQITTVQLVSWLLTLGGISQALKSLSIETWKLNWWKVLKTSQCSLIIGEIQRPLIWQLTTILKCNCRVRSLGRQHVLIWWSSND